MVHRLNGLREGFVGDVLSMCGAPYIYGGQSPEGGFDCSGLIVWAIRKQGFPIDDLSAQGLADFFHHNKKLYCGAEPGDLLFYGPSADDIQHVMVVVRVWSSGEPVPAMALCGARGGDKTTTTIEEAYRRGAMVDVVLGRYWLSNLQFIRGID